LPDKGTDGLPSNSMRLLARVGLVIGEYKLEPRDMKHDAPRPPNGPDPAARGLYIAKSSCTECHGQQLAGGDATPALSVVAAYSPVEFARLMREGIPRDGRKLDLMARTARNRFVHLTDDEVTALYTYLSGQLASGKTND
jgi:mono/diheme cytochrome c family protein